MNKRKILIAISYELGENTYENTKIQNPVTAEFKDMNLNRKK